MSYVKGDRVIEKSQKIRQRRKYFLQFEEVMIITIGNITWPTKRVWQPWHRNEHMTKFEDLLISLTFKRHSARM